MDSDVSTTEFSEHYTHIRMQLDHTHSCISGLKKLAASDIISGDLVTKSASLLQLSSMMWSSHRVAHTVCALDSS